MLQIAAAPENILNDQQKTDLWLIHKKGHIILVIFLSKKKPENLIC